MRTKDRAGGNIPVDLTGFVGRQHELAEVEAVLTESRMVTLTGVGGAGKSRLASRVAQRAGHTFAAGAWLVDLSELREPSLLMATVATAPGLRSLGKDPESTVAEYLADKELLLVLDNCEHLVTQSAALVRTLLGATERLRIIVASRKRLRVRGEYVVEVSPLPVSDDGLQSGGDALALFQERASAVLPDFVVDHTNRAAVARLCRCLDGLPLAIELAAVWIRVLPVEQILSRRGGLPDLFSTDRASWSSVRHRTMRSAADWSSQLRSAREQRVWRRVPVFVAGFDPDAAESVCCDDVLPLSDVRAGLAELVRHSVLIRERGEFGVRYRLLETIRDYGRQRLRESGEQMSLSRRHRDYYRRLAERVEADWFGTQQLSWLKRSRLEHANIRMALDFCVSTPGEAACGLRFAGGLWWHWVAQGLLFEGAHWLDRMLERARAPSRDRAQALWVRGWIAQVQGRHERTLSFMDQCGELAERLGDERAPAYATQFAGYAEAVPGNGQRGVRLLERAVASHRATGTVNRVTQLGSGLLGLMLSLTGDFDRAKELVEDTRKLSEAHGERWVLSWTLSMLGKLRWGQGTSGGRPPRSGRHCGASRISTTDWESRSISKPWRGSSWPRASPGARRDCWVRSARCGITSACPCWDSPSSWAGTRSARRGRTRRSTTGSSTLCTGRGGT